MLVRRFSRLPALVLVASTLLVAAPAHATYPGGDGRIAFVREGSIWTAEADGSDERRLTWRGVAATPVWSPDGRSIAYAWDVPNRKSELDLWTMRADGSDKRRITDARSAEFDPTWSPDGVWLAFASNRGAAGTPHPWIYRTRVARPSASWVRLTSPASSETVPEGDHQPDWSSRGLIVFSRAFAPGLSSSGAWTEPWIVSPGGGDESPVPNPARAHSRWDPSWSPGARRIAYTVSTYDENDDADSRDVLLMSRDGGHVREVTHYGAGSGFFADDPVWSPDGGRFIAYSLYGDLQVLGIWRVGVRGLDPPVQIIENATSPDWQPLPDPA